MAAQEGWQRQPIRVVEAAQLGLRQWPNKDSREKKGGGERGDTFGPLGLLVGKEIE